MGRNIKIKARLHSPVVQAGLAVGLADGPAEVLRQEDTFFNVPQGRLKLREFGDGTGEAEGVAIVDELTTALDIRPEDLVRCAYIDLLEPV